MAEERQAAFMLYPIHAAHICSSARVCLIDSFRDVVEWQAVDLLTQKWP